MEAIRRSLGGEAAELAEAGSELADEEPGSGGPAMITLENSPGGGCGLGVDLDELAAIADGPGRGRDRGATGSAFCLDTAHAWGAGIDVSTARPRSMRSWEHSATGSASTGWPWSTSTTRAPSGARGSTGTSTSGPAGSARAGLGALLRHPRLAAATYILETPGMDEGYDAINLARAAALARGDALDDLPAEAFAIRGGRARAATPALAGAANRTPVP